MERLFLFFRWAVTLSVTAFIGFFGGAGAMTLVLSLYDKPPENVAEKNVLQSTTTAPTNSPSPQQISRDLEKVVLSELTGTKGKYGIVIEHLTTGERYVQNEDRIYETASLYKLWVMATVFEAIEDHRLNKKDVLRQNIEVLNQKFRIASESAERTEGTISLTIEEALHRMITYSDNYSALLLTEKIRLSTVSAFLRSHDFTDSKVGTGGNNPMTTPHDIARFYKELYNGKLIDAESSKEMIDILKQQKLNKKIPKYLPPNTEIGHKTGELGAFSHDAGIIYIPNGDYLFVILSESSSRIQADERIAGVSRAVYQYFQNKK